MKKLLITTAFGLCTLPAMAAGPLLPNTQPSLAGAKPAAAGSTAPGSLTQLPLPPVQISGQLTSAPSGTALQPNLQPVALPGLGTLTATYSNPGQGAHDSAETSIALNLNQQSSQTPTQVFSSVNDPKGQLSFDNELKTQSTGTASHPNLSATTVPLVGTLSPTYNDGGPGKTLDATLNYNSAAPQPLPGSSK